MIVFMPIVLLAAQQPAPPAPVVNVPIYVPPAPPRPTLARGPALLNAVEIFSKQSKDLPPVDGVVRFRVVLTADARVVSCTILESSGNAKLDAHACALVRKKGKFRAARDAKGRSIPASYTLRARWQPALEEPPLKPDGSP